MFINRFSASHGGEKAIAAYACISYIICIIYLILQGVGDGCQPLLSRCYGEKDTMKLKYFRRKAYLFAIFLAAAGGFLMFVFRVKIGLPQPVFMQRKEVCSLTQQQWPNLALCLHLC